MSIKTNEREIASKLAEWINDHIKTGVYPFKEASNETGVKLDKKTRYADIVIWKNRETCEAYSYLEIKPPWNNKENLETFKEKALKLKVKYAFTWDFQSLNVYKLEGHHIKAHDSIPRPILNDINEWLRGDKQAEIKGYIYWLCEEIEKLNNTGKLSRFDPEKVYFINLIRETKNKLIPEFEKFIKDQQRKSGNKAIIDKYVIEQGISMANDEAYFRIIASQRVYGLITKIIFYLTIRRFFKDLPDLIAESELDLHTSIKHAFVKASEKDWQAVFINDPIEELGIPSTVEATLRTFFKELKIYHFVNLKEDVIGELFEEIIDPNDRHSLGQYFTREDLVDFVIATVVNEKEGVYSDPTCGSGTFLIRLYDRLKYLGRSKKHEEILSQIWGIDIGKFPAELSTVNLFRQQVSNFENFPRVLNKSIFDIYKGYISEFPPPFAGREYKKIQVPFPEITAFVGNFPFIRQELIEKKDKGFKDHLTILLAQEYLLEYSKLFELKKEVLLFLQELANYNPEKKKKWITEQVKKKGIQLKLSGQADIYSYIYIHTATLLSKNGKFAIITSNSWLDVAYGQVLKEFFLDYFKINMIVASWAEPWFEDAAVNTVITVLEKKEQHSNTNDHMVKFVKLKQKFEDLIPQRDLQLQSIKRWERIDGLIREIENVQYKKEFTKITRKISSYETAEMRVRVLSQGELINEVSDKGETSKWGKYLRAPDVYFEILETCHEKLVPFRSVADIRWGIKTGINNFFYLQPLNNSGVNTDLIKCKNAKGFEVDIESIYLKKVINSPKHIEGYIVNSEKLDIVLFVCNVSKKELKSRGHYGALEYIEWGERQVTKEGHKWSEVPSVQGRKDWYNINEEGNFEFIMPQFYDKKFVIPHLNNSAVATNNFFIVNSKDNKEIPNKEFFNSTLYYLFIEIAGRTNMGEGVLTLYGPDIDSTYLMSDQVKMNSPTKLTHNVMSIFDEIKLKNRRELDEIVLTALGLDHREWLPKIYSGLTEVVQERLELPKMRKKQKKEKEKFSYEEVKNSVIKDILSIKRTFPEGFYNVTKNQIEYDAYSCSTRDLVIESFFDQHLIKDKEGNLIFETNSEVKAEYAVILARSSRSYILKIPKDEAACKEIVLSFKNYVDELSDLLCSNAQMKLHDWPLSEKMAKEILQEENLFY
jgi:hypothetical protein